MRYAIFKFSNHPKPQPEDQSKLENEYSPQATLSWT